MSRTPNTTHAKTVVDAEISANGAFAPAEWVAQALAWRVPDATHEPPAPEMAVESLIQRGHTGVLVAAGGTGKTVLLLHLAICHATGRPFIGLKVREGSFALFSLDDSQEDLDAALVLVMRAANLTRDEMARVKKRVRVFSLQDQQGEPRAFTMAFNRQQVEATDLAEHLFCACSGLPDLVGVALDTLRQFSGGSSNDEQTMKLAVAGAGQLVRHFLGRIYALVPHHTGKAQYRNGVADLYAGSGSAAIGDNARFVLTLAEAQWDDVDARFVEPISREGDALELTAGRGSLLVRKRTEPICIRRVGYRFEAIAGTLMTHDEKTRDLDRRILRAVQEGARSGNAVFAAIGGKREVVQGRFKALKTAGLIRSVPGGTPLGVPAGLGLSDVAKEMLR